MLLRASRKTVWLVEAVQAHHNDLPPAFPAWLGSPTSFVADVFVPVTRLLTDAMLRAFANWSLIGTAPCVAPAKNDPKTKAIHS